MTWRLGNKGTPRRAGARLRHVIRYIAAGVTRRAIDRVIALLGRDRPLTEVTDAEIGTALTELWGASALASTCTSCASARHPPRRSRSTAAAHHGQDRHKNPRTAMRYVKPGAEAIAKVAEILAPRRRTH